MRRFLFGAALLAAMVFFAFRVTDGADRQLTPIADTLQEASRQWLSGELTAARTLTRQAMAAWDQLWTRVAFISDHVPMDQIDSLFAQMDTLCQEGDASALASFCAQAAQLIRSIVTAQRPALWNIF